MVGWKSKSKMLLKVAVDSETDSSWKGNEKFPAS